MKPLFFGLVLLNVCYLLFQQVTAADPQADGAADGAADQRAEVSADAALLTSHAPSEGVADLPEPVPASVAELTVIQAPDAGKAVATQLTSENDKIESTGASTANRVADTEIVAIAPPVTRCVIAGPFREQRDGQALVKQLANAGIKATLQPRDTALLPDYMVYVGPQKSKAQATDLQAIFTARKMDSHVIAAGALQHALSLGVFSRGALAKSLHQQLKDEGFEARISELTRNRRGYQVQTQLPQLIRARLLEADTPMIDCPQTIAQR